MKPINYHQPSLNSIIEFGALLVFLGLLTIWRYSVMSNMDSSLYLDEAQYWYWANNLEFGYYSKPPMVALIIAATTTFGGDSETAIRLGSILIYPLTTLLIYLIGRHLYSAKVGLTSAMLFILMPAVSVSSLIISTDVAFFFFWAMALYSLLRAISNNSWVWWASLGVAGGLGMQTKYTMGVFVISAIIFLVISKQWRVFLNVRLWFSGGVAALIWLPNLIWNYHNDFITFQHTYEISQSSQKMFHWKELATFIGGQFGVFGIISFVLLLYITIKGKINHKSFLMSFTWIFILIISWQALTGGANANWAAPAFVAGSVALGAWLVNYKQWRWAFAALSLNLLMAAGLYYFEPTLNVLGIEKTSKNDIYKRLKGWSDLGQQFSAIKEQYPDAVLLGDKDRTIISQLVYQARPIKVSTWNASGPIRHHYDIHNKLETLSVRNFLYVSRTPLSVEIRETFVNSRNVGRLIRTLYPDEPSIYYVYLLTDFKGYQQ